MSFNPEFIKVKAAAKQATSIRLALKKSLDSKAIARAWAEANPVGGEVSTESARQWALINAYPDSKEISKALRKLYGIGWALGEDIALYQVAKKIKFKAVSRKEVARAASINWNDWQPGNRAAAALLKPKGGLQLLLDRRGIVIQELTRTSLDRIGTQLSRALAQGLTPQKTSVLIDRVINDPVRALTIAQTEMTRAVVEANYQVYAETGVEYLEYLVADPCDDCSENLAASPIPFGEEFPNGNPPVHPNCMCDIAPYVVDTQSVFTE